MAKKIIQKTLASAFSLAIAASSTSFAPQSKLTFSNSMAASAASDETGNSEDTYKSVFERFFPIGGLIDMNNPRNDYILDNYTLLSEEYGLKPDHLLNQEDCQASGSETEVPVSFHFAEPTLELCNEYHIPLFGSTFVWYSQTPQWFFREGFQNSTAYVDKETMDKRLESFIKNTFEELAWQYPDLTISAYEVCKEVFVNDGGDLRPASDNAWMQIYGSDEYIINAYKYARKYAPTGTKLYYSDYNEYMPEKTSDICDLAQKILDEGDYLDGIGMEAVLDVSYPTLDAFQTALTQFESLDLDIMLTEFSVYDESRSEKQLEIYRDILSICMDHHQNISGVILDDSFGCGWKPCTAPTIQKILDHSFIRFSFMDADTNEYINFDEISFAPTVGYRDDEDVIAYIDMADVSANMNPYFWKCKYGNADILNFDINKDSVPQGYTLADSDTKITQYDNGFADVVVKLKREAKAPLNPGEARIIITDSETGELIPWKDIDSVSMSTDIGYKKSDVPGGWIYTGPIYRINSNPYYCDLAKYMNADKFNVSLGAIPDGYYLIKGGTKYTMNTNQSLEIEFQLKKLPKGDVNADERFSIADVVLFQKWLLAIPDTQLKSWKAADYNDDKVLNVSDLTLMKQKLRSKVVAPDLTVVNPSTFITLEERTLFKGPDESYESITVIPADTRMSELGYNSNEHWLYTKYDGQYGWIKAVKDDSLLPTIYFEQYAAKPVIYLYPEQETDVHVELELTESELSTTYPKYQNGWDVTAYPDGTLVNKADGTHHEYLFWDSANCRTRFDFSKGFCVAGSDTESFLKEKLTYMGLTESEMNEFIVYWLPLMEHNAYNLIAFQGETYTDSAKLNITPTPDSLLRVFMAYVPLESAVEIEPQELATFERIGFTVVEWGGCNIK